MSDRTIVVESRTILSQFAVRESVFAARVATTVSRHTRANGEVDPNSSVVVATGVQKFLQLSVEKPMMVRLIVDGESNTTLDLVVAEHLTLTAAFTSVTVFNTDTGDTAVPISYRVLFA